LDENKKNFIHQISKKYYENGLTIRATSLKDQQFFSMLRERVKYFDSEKEFIDEFTFVSKLELANYRRIFITFYSILFSLLFVFALNIVYKGWKNHFLFYYRISRIIFHKIYEITTFKYFS
jgi:hypothetical protein